MDTHSSRATSDSTTTRAVISLVREAIGKTASGCLAATRSPLLAWATTALTDARAGASAVAGASPAAGANAHNANKMVAAIRERAEELDGVPRRFGVEAPRITPEA